MPAAPIIAGVGLAVSAVGTVASISAQNRMAKAQQQQYRYERQMQQNRSVRERRDAIRAARLAGASLTSRAEASGVAGASAPLGGLGSIQSQLNSNLSFLDTQGSLANRASLESGKAAQSRVVASNWGAVSDLGMAVFKIADSKG